MKTNFFVILCFLLFIQSCQKQEASITQLPIHQKVERIFQKDISNAIAYTDSLSKHPEQFDYYFKKSRAEFKKLEMVMAFSNAENYASLNQPNILKIREEDKTDIKILDPLGYQVLEETIYDETIDTVEVLKNASFILNRLKIVKENTQFNHLKNYHFLWMLKKEIARISLTGITGFDSPILENSLQDAQVVYATIKEYLLSIQNEFKDQTLFDQWNSEIDQSIASLSGDFNAFDRYSFIKNHTHKQLELYTKTVKDWDVSFPFALELNDASISLFSDTTFNLEKFASFQTRQITNEKIALGKQLFYDKTLSRDNTTSCATCHQIDKAFTDGLKISKNVTRNSPTLLYTALQRGFFYDKRTGGLEGQVVDVINNKEEFHTNFEAVESVVKDSEKYTQMYTEAYPNKDVDQFYIRNAMATYIRTLTPFNSKFDRNINGQENTLTKEEISGFNLFTGKAKCATCHFAPVFNGTIPPDFKETEMELIGTPEKSDTINAVISKDLGRYSVFQTKERKHFFKAPTIRNIALTAPYMHNGVYQTLEEVVDFYNRGGGAGIGIEQELQTLPPDPLNLTEAEQKALVAFMKTLTDDLEKAEY